jgi:hypothetical protein
MVRDVLTARANDAVSVCRMVREAVTARVIDAVTV